MPKLNQEILNAIKNNCYLNNKEVKKSLMGAWSGDILQLREPSEFGGDIQIDENEAIQLFYALKTNYEIKQLNFSLGFNFTPAVIKALQELLNSQPTIKKLKFSYLYESQQQNLVRVLQSVSRPINLTINTITVNDEIINQIAKLIDLNYIKELNISTHHFNANSDTLFKALSTSECLSKLIFNIPTFDGHAETFAQSLKKNSSIQDLTIKTGLSLAAYTTITNSLQGNKNINYIAMDLNPLSVPKFEEEFQNKLISFVESLENLLDLKIYINAPDQYCRHSANVSCHLCKQQDLISDQTEDQIQELISQKHINAINDCITLCQTMLAEIIKFSRKEIANVNETQIIKTYEQVIVTIANAEKNINYYKFDNKILALKELQLEIFCRLHETFNAIQFFKEHFKYQNKKAKSQAYNLIGNTLLLETENYFPGQPEYEMLMFEACSYFIWSVCWGDKENWRMVLDLLERIMCQTFTHIELADIICRPQFIETVWPRLIAKIDETALNQKLKLSFTPLLSTEQLLNNIDLFCQYICHEDKRFMISSELWRFQSKYYQMEHSKRKSNGANTTFNDHSFFKRHHTLKHTETKELDSSATSFPKSDSKSPWLAEFK